MWSQILIWRCRTYYYHQLVSAVYKDSDASPKNHTCSCIQWMYMNNCICSMFKWHEGGHTCILLCNCGLYSHKKVTLNLEEIMECEKLDWLVKTGVTAITQEGLSQFPKLTHHHPGYSCGSHPPSFAQSLCRPKCYHIYIYGGLGKTSLMSFPVISMGSSLVSTRLLSQTSP